MAPGLSQIEPKLIPSELSRLLQSGTALNANNRQDAISQALSNGKAPTELTTQLSRLIAGLPESSVLKDSSQIANLLQPNSTVSPLLKLVLPLLKSVLMTSPSGQPEQEQLPKLSQLLARTLLSAIRAPGAGPESELGRGELLSRFENSLDTFQFELGIVRERYSGEKPQAEDEESTINKVRQWTVRLSFEFEELGLVTAFVVLTNQSQIEMNFWAERDDTRKQIEQQRQQFRSRLDNVLSPHGIERLEIGVHEGDPPPPKSQVTTQLVNEIA